MDECCVIRFTIGMTYMVISGLDLLLPQASIAVATTLQAAQLHIFLFHASPRMERLICVRQLNEDVSLGHLRDPTEPAPSILIVFMAKGHNSDDSTSEVTRRPAIGSGTARSRRTERAETRSGDGRENRTNRDREPRRRTRRHTTHTPTRARTQFARRGVKKSRHRSRGL